MKSSPFPLVIAASTHRKDARPHQIFDTNKCPSPYTGPEGVGWFLPKFRERRSRFCSRSPGVLSTAFIESRPWARSPGIISPGVTTDVVETEVGAGMLPPTFTRYSRGCRSNIELRICPRCTGRTELSANCMRATPLEVSSFSTTTFSPMWRQSTVGAPAQAKGGSIYP